MPPPAIAMPVFVLPLVFAAATFAASAPRDATAGPEASTDDAPSRAPWIVRLRPRPNLWELGGFGGVFVIPTRHDLYDLHTSPQQPFRRAAPEAGLRAAYFPLAFVGAEAELAGMWSQVDRTAEPVLLWTARAHAILQLPLYRVVPFILGGYGLMGVRSSHAAVGSDLDPVGHLGAGVKLELTKAIALRLDGRWILGARAASRREVVHYGSVTFGLSITLGSGRAGARHSGST